MVKFIEKTIENFFEELNNNKTLDELNDFVRNDSGSIPAYLSNSYHNLNCVSSKTFNFRLENYVTNILNIKESEKVNYICDFIKHPEDYDKSKMFPKKVYER